MDSVPGVETRTTVNKLTEVLFSKFVWPDNIGAMVFEIVASMGWPDFRFTLV